MKKGDYQTLVRHTVISFGGYAVPVLAALPCVPFLVHSLGTERFGVFSLMAVVVGYAGLFDFGLGRTLARMSAHRLGAGRAGEVSPLFWTAFGLLSGLGGVGSAVLVGTAPFLVQGLGISPEYQEDVTRALGVLALSVPLSMFSAGFRNMLQAYKQFRTVSVISALSGSLNFVAPAIVLVFFNSLLAVSAALLTSRALITSVYAVRSFTSIPDIDTPRRSSFDTPTARELLTFGGWMSITNIIGPIFFYSDRVVLGFKHSAEAVAYYSTPYDVMVRVLMVSAALIDVMFPEFSRWYGQGSGVRRLYGRVNRDLFMVVAPLCLVLALAAHTLLELWLGVEFADNGFRVVQLMAFGIVLNSLARVSQALIQTSGRPSWTAGLQIAELALYAVYMPILIERFGVNGAALSWVIRVTISFVALAYLARYCMTEKG